MVATTVVGCVRHERDTDSKHHLTLCCKMASKEKHIGGFRIEAYLHTICILPTCEKNLQIINQSIRSHNAEEYFANTLLVKIHCDGMGGLMGDSMIVWFL